MVYFLLWYVLTSLAGLAAFPLAYRLLPALADRGYALSRTLGWLVWGFIFWLLASLGVLRNEPGSLLLALLALAGLSAWALHRHTAAFKAWWKPNLRLVLTVEVLFLATFAAMAFVRASNPEATGTEKPMELAFINAILNSPTFPPHDPWLSGYAISYYHFGYILVAMLAKLTGTPGGVAFNLGVTLVFALSAAGVYGMVYNLLAGERPGQPGRATSGRWRGLLPALLGPLYILVLSNLEGFLQVLHNGGMFWQRDASGQLVSPFWKWLDITNLNQPPEQPFSWIPTRFWWWWRASRVIQDYDFSGNLKEIINEFPFFSYLLADSHPHVLAMPFAFLGMALALNIFLGGGRGRLGWLQRRFNLQTLAWVSTLAFCFGIALQILALSPLSLKLLALGVLLFILGAAGLANLLPFIQQEGLRLLIRRDLGEAEIGQPLYINLPAFLLAAVVMGGMSFLNTWDFPIQVALFSGAYAWVRSRQSGWSWGRLGDFLFCGILLGIAGGILYLPFYVGFSSQAGGLLPNLIYPTRGAQFWVMFAPLLLPLFAFLAWLGNRSRVDGLPISGFLRRSLLIAAGAALLLWLLALILGAAITFLPMLGDLYMQSLGATALGPLLQQAIARRLSNTGGWLTLLVLVVANLALLLAAASAHPAGQVRAFSRNRIFVLILVLLGVLLTFGPEFFFLRDQFGWRINTIFKFYFQAWLYWGTAAAFASVLLLSQHPTGRGRIWSYIFGVSWFALLAMSLAYPLFSLWSKTEGFQPAGGRTLDATAYFARSSPDEMAGIRWLQAAPDGVIAEAVSPTGGSYTEYARAATLSGKANVLGWMGHESQWRGGSEEMGSRQADIERLYCTRDSETARQILDQYHIRYVFIGNLERVTYQPGGENCPIGLNEVKFRGILTPVFQQGEVVIYEYATNNQ